MEEFELISGEIERLYDSTHSIEMNVASAESQGEMEIVMQQAERLRHALRGLRHKSRMDPEVLELERKLDETLSRSYMLWQKYRN